MTSPSAETKLTSRTTILLGPAGAGKTALLVDRLVGRPGSVQPRWAVLPDRTQVASFRRRIAAAGGALGVSVGTFGDLFQEILARAGRPVALTPEPARQRILRLAIRRLETQGALPYFQPISRTAGFLEVVGEALAELRQGRIGPDQLAARGKTAVRGQGPAELARIFAEFESQLDRIPWTDSEGLNGLAIDAMKEHPGLLGEMPLIAVDGFDSFEAAQLEALTGLSGQVEQLVVTLPGDGGSLRPAYRRFSIPLARLRAALPGAAIVQLGPPAALPEALVRLEAGLFERDAVPFEPRTHLQLIEARTSGDETREALRWIKARILRDGVSPEDCAVIAPDPVRYTPLLRRSADEFGLLLRFAHGESLSRAPAVAAVLDLLELSRSNWPRRMTLQIVRSPFFDLADFGFLPGDVLALDAASHAGQVVEGLDQWREALEQLSRLEPDPRWETLEEESSSPSLPLGEAARRLAGAMESLGRRITPTERRSTTEWVGWLEDLLEEVGFPVRTGSDSSPDRGAAERPAFERLRETLRALVLGESLTGPQVLGYGEFLDELHSSIGSASYREQPTASPAVDVLGLLDARGGRYRAVAILGLSEGVLPEVEREDPFLDEELRAALGLESRLVRHQAGLFYQAVTRSDEFLLLTRSYLADDGEAWEPSPFWHSVRQLLTAQPRRRRPEDQRPLQEAGSPNELLFWGVRRGSMPASLLEPLRDRWERLQHRREVLSARLGTEPLGPYEGGLVGSAADLTARFGPEHLWSPSRLEVYATCPHMFFAAHLLGLSAQEPPRPGLDPRQVGSLLHELLEAAYRNATDPAAPESVLEALEGAQAAIFEDAPRRHGFRPTALWAIERTEYVEAIEATIRGLAELGTEWVPIGLELPFGMHGHPALDLDLGGSHVRIRGVIDRLDRRADGSLRVIDYKTGQSSLSPHDLNQGRRIQLPLYSLAAQETLGLGRVVEGFYWAIRAGRRGSLRLSQYQAPEPLDGRGPAGAHATARAQVRRIVEGVRSGDFRPIPPTGGCPDYCPATAWCWRYRPAIR